MMRSLTITSTTTRTFLSLLSLLCQPGGRGIASYYVRADDDIELWTNYAIYPKKCVHYNDNDMIVYAMYEQASNHCVDSPMGTYVSSVPTFVNAYLEQAADNAADAGEEYEYPASSVYLDCTLRQIGGVDYYVQVGCSDYDPTGLAVNIYSDALCTEHSQVDGYDDSNIAVDFTISFGKCMPCVVWFDKNADDIDDMYYVNKQKNAPLCSAMWEYKQTCNDKCQKLGNLASMDGGWNEADKVLLTVLSLFGFGMLLAITKKRQKMSNKDNLLEQAAITAAGLQQSHILGIFALLILIITIFGLLGLKKITWALLLILNITLFSYLMKLTLDGSVKESIIGPDGKIVEVDDSDDEDDADHDSDGPKGADSEYESPKCSPIFEDKAIV